MASTAKKIKLTHEQRVGIIEYMLTGVSKGIFEDTDIFAELDGEDYSAARDATERFVDRLKREALRREAERKEG